MEPDICLRVRLWMVPALDMEISSEPIVLVIVFQRGTTRPVVYIAVFRHSRLIKGNIMKVRLELMRSNIFHILLSRWSLKNSWQQAGGLSFLWTVPSPLNTHSSLRHDWQPHRDQKHSRGQLVALVHENKSIFYSRYESIPGRQRVE